MRPVSIVLCVAPVALNGFSLAPASNRFQWYVLAASLVLALALLVLMLVGRGRRPQAKTEPGPVFLLQADKLPTASCQRCARLRRPAGLRYPPSALRPYEAYLVSAAV